jgi:hypothetical protein
MAIVKDLTGKVFGMLTVISRESSRKPGTYWNCLCECGDVAVVRGDHLKDGRTKSCGCYIREDSFEDLVGNKYGSLTAVSRAREKGSPVHWNCMCDCGKMVVVRAECLKRGSTRSCGCYKYARLYKHGLCDHPLYKVWESMSSRCNNPNERSFHNYGGRDISITDEWKNPEAFIRWSLENGWEPGLQIDREDNDKGYSPDNCRFVTSKVNNNNTRMLISTNKSGYRGASFSKQAGKFAGHIAGNDPVFNGKKMKHLGYFNTAREAAIARDQFILKHDLPYRKLQVLERDTK